MTSHQHRIVLGVDELRALVSGRAGSVRCTCGELVEVLLADISYRQLAIIVSEAVRRDSLSQEPGGWKRRRRS